MFWFYQAVSRYLSRVLQIKTDLIQSPCDPLEDPLLLKDQLDLAFICGLPLIRYDRMMPEQLRVLVAPVMQAPRYQGCPVYFSDIIVRATSGLTCFEHLAGKTLCYNDLGSNSGYNLVRQRLMESGYSQPFFGKVIPSGSHQASMQWVAKGVADCSAIDSTVLEQELSLSPDLSSQIRVIDSMGPCPMPPVIAAQHLGAELLHQIQAALLQPDPDLQAAMEQARIQHYAAVNVEDYEAIVQIYNAALEAGYETL